MHFLHKWLQKYKFYFISPNYKVKFAHLPSTINNPLFKTAIFNDVHDERHLRRLLRYRHHRVKLHR